MAMVPITPRQVAHGWQEIWRQEEMQRQLLETEDVRPDVQQSQKQANIANDESKSQQSIPPPSTRQKTRSSDAKKTKESVKKIQQSSQQAVPISSLEPGQMTSPTPDLDDNEPDRL